MNAAVPRLAVHGAGRMGRLVADLAGEHGFELLGLVARHHPGDGPDTAWYPGFDALPGPPDVVIDFTLPAGVTAAARWCASHGVPLVTGTTGLDATQRGVLEAAASQVPVLHAANFSPGVNVLLALLRSAAPLLDERAALSLTDVHHVHKKDSPSGTALALAEALAPHAVTIDSRREGEVIGDHTVHIRLPGEQLQLGHHAEDRSIFARGALHAARWIIGRPPGRYTATDSLGAVPH